jgi:hypothetical protein
MSNDKVEYSAEKETLKDIEDKNGTSDTSHSLVEKKTSTSKNNHKMIRINKKT